MVSLFLTPFLGSDFFPAVDAGLITLHARTPAGTRIEDTLQVFQRVEDQVRGVIPKRDLGTIVDNIGQPFSPLNIIYSNTGLAGGQDGDIFITLNAGHNPTANYVRRLREVLPRAFPGTTFSYPPADIVSQILNFGTPAPLDVQVTGVNSDATMAYAKRLLRQLRDVPGIADTRIQQSTSFPQLNVDADRTRMARLGLTERDVSNSVATALAGTSQTAPAFWLNPTNGVSYGIVAQTPEYSLDSLEELQNLPVTGASGTAAPQMLAGIASISRSQPS